MASVRGPKPARCGIRHGAAKVLRVGRSGRRGGPLAKEVFTNFARYSANWAEKKEGATSCLQVPALRLALHFAAMVRLTKPRCGGWSSGKSTQASTFLCRAAQRARAPRLRTKNICAS